MLKALRDWLRVSPNPDYVLVNLKTKEPMTSLQITQNLTRLWAAGAARVHRTLWRHFLLSPEFHPILH
eukprot:COSAG03_NODE_3650_length_1898_cov_8.266259_1_plen_68_part_00